MVKAMKVDLESTIKRNFDSFSKGFRKVAEYILENREGIPFISALNLGREVGVSESTVLRFIKFIGYSGYPDLQKDLAEWIKGKIKPSQKLRKISPGKKGDIHIPILNNDIRHLLLLRKNLSQDQLERVTKLLTRARKKYILGFRTSYSMAYLSSFFLGRILKDVVLLRLEDHNFYNILAEANKKDIALAFSFPRYSKHTLKLVQFLKEKQCKVIGITDRITSPLGRISDFVFEVASSSPTYFNSFTAVISLINCIIQAISLKNLRQSTASLRKAEQVVDDFDILVL
jgi:DNA-binding MurR/RpiR family transcriptional regulator